MVWPRPFFIDTGEIALVQIWLLEPVTFAQPGRMSNECSNRTSCLHLTGCSVRAKLLELEQSQIVQALQKNERQDLWPGRCGGAVGDASDDPLIENGRGEITRITP